MLENDVEIVLWRTGGQDVRTSRRKAFTPGGGKNDVHAEESREGRRTNCWLTNLSSRSVKEERRDSEWLRLIIKCT